MESTQKFRATLHAGRTHMLNGRSTGLVYNVHHNDRDFKPEKTDHINAALQERNLHYVADENGNIMPKASNQTYAAWERQMYEIYFSEWLEKQNERHVKGGHASRKRTMEAILESQRQAPREEILAIGNFGNRCQDEDAFIEIVHEYVRTLQERYPNIRILDYSIHRDEEVRKEVNGEVTAAASNIHAHLRTCYVFKNADGDLEPNQSKALAAMGIEAPKPDAKIDRWNNPVITLSEQCRELYIEIASRHGFDIEMEPACPGKRTLNKKEYVAQVLREENEQLAAEQIVLKAEKESLEQEIQESTRKSHSLRRKQEKLEKKVEELKQEEGRLRGLLWHLKELLSPFDALLRKLQNFRLTPTRSLLDDVLLDSKTAGCVDIMRELEDCR